MRLIDMEGQLTIFDAYQDDRPCRYRFKRYVGQKVNVMIGPYMDHRIVTGVITEIGPYYTTVRSGKKEYAATPYNLMEVK